MVPNKQSNRKEMLSPQSELNFIKAGARGGPPLYEKKEAINDASSTKNRPSEHRIGDMKVETTLSMKGTLVNKGRCPVCTLKPPCKHYGGMDDLPSVT